ncbi:MAG TPA: uroporphyrinogen decarboxylase family protein [Armatimonadota bacterium]|jgi:uroporphyrinogen decarboxylase
MTSRERVQMLLRRELPDHMGLYEHMWPETIPQCWVNEGYPEGQPPEEVFDYDLRGAGGWLDSTPFPGVNELVEETDEWRVSRDGRGATLKHWKNKSGTPQHIGFTVTDPQKWQEYKEPLLATSRDRLGIDTARADLEKVRAAGKFAFFGNLIFIELLRGMLGDLVWLPSLLTEKAWIHDINRTFLDFFKRHYALLFAEVGVPDGMFMYDDMAFSNGPFASPATMRELFLPYWRELNGFFHDYGLPVILHSCGDVRQLMPIIVEAEFDCLQPMEAKAGNNVVEFAKEYGDKLAFMGNIDVTVLNTNDRAKVRAEIEGKLTALKQLRAAYFFHSDHSIPPDVRYETYQYALEVYRELREY